MNHRVLRLQLPPTSPFDKENWFESFVGEFVRPLVLTEKVEKYWFSRYEDQENGRHVGFRFSTRFLTEIDPQIIALISTLQLKHLDPYRDYDYVADLGSNRFLGENTAANRECRATLVYDFLYTTSRLFLDFLAYSEPPGYWHLESETSSGQNRLNSFESLHHLFCNTTDCLTTVMQVTDSITGNTFLVSPINFSWLPNNNSLKLDCHERVRF